VNSIAFNIDALFLEHRDSLIKTICNIVGCPQTAEDLAQEAYLKMRLASQTGEIDYPRSFLYKIGHNLALDHLRKQQLRQGGKIQTRPEDEDTESFLENIAAETPTPEQHADNQQQVALMLSVLAGLPERRRQILVLHKFHHWNYERIAKHFGISRSAVEKNVYAALAHLLAAQNGHAK
jgi:RNA polymerase sigma factor (sigma-70 family)